MSCRAVVMGCSAGGMEAVSEILVQLPPTFRLPVIIVQHLNKDQGGSLAHLYGSRTSLKVEEAEEKKKIMPEHVYLAPPDYHLLVERDETFSLSVDEKVNYSRPSIDVLFESAAEAYGPELAGVLLSGANSDGALGLQRIREHGGMVLVQDPGTALFAEMPKSGLRRTEADHVLSPQAIGRLLAGLQAQSRSTA